MRIGSLCSGYGGLELAVQAVMGGETAWVSDIDKGACKILAHRFPGVPNIGDMTGVDWAAVEPVHLICGGTPCQDLSHAGKRAGMTVGTRSNLWVAMREAIAVIRPRYVVWENVRGAAFAEADSDLVNQPRLLAGVRRRPGQPVLRALGRVVGDLSDLGYVGQVRGLRAADVGAPHGRFRYFILATDAHSEGRGGLGWEHTAGRDVDGRRGADRPRQATEPAALLPTPRAGDGDKGGPNQRGSSGDLMLPSAVTHLLPSPRTSDTNGARHHGDGGMDLRTVVSLLLTPAVNDMGEGKTPEAWDAWTERMKAAHGNGNGHGASLSIEAQRLLPTPQASDCDGGRTRSMEALRLGNRQEQLTDIRRLLEMRWGQYAAAIHRWETITRPAPPPTETGPKGNPRLSAGFSEWLMGLPAGWVTDVPGITRNEALRALGNGVVPQQGAAAIAEMLAWRAAA